MSSNQHQEPGHFQSPNSLPFRHWPRTTLRSCCTYKNEVPCAWLIFKFYFNHISNMSLGAFFFNNWVMQQNYWGITGNYVMSGHSSITCLKQQKSDCVMTTMWQIGDTVVLCKDSPTQAWRQQEKILYINNIYTNIVLSWSGLKHRIFWFVGRYVQERKLSELYLCLLTKVSCSWWFIHFETKQLNKSLHYVLKELSLVGLLLCSNPNNNIVYIRCL